MSQIRTLTTPNDFGPPTVTRTRISRNGLGARLIVKGNPFAFLVDVAPCIPFLNLMGGQNAQSRAVRAGVLDNNADAGGMLTADNQTTNTVSNPPPTTNPPPPAGGSGGGSTPSGPFAYIRASKTGG